MKKNWDIFCRIVDNFGDIGVCWRLAKQLNGEYGLAVTLWIDDLNVAQKIIPQLDASLDQQMVDKIKLLKWQDKADFTIAADVVIEAFACELPALYISAMAEKKSKWINLEYLSAESWVADFHAKPSPQANGLIRYFYFPGFTDKTGGLIRESGIKQLKPTDDAALLENDQCCLKVSLFCYPNAPIQDLLAALQGNKNKVVVYVPDSSILSKVADYFGRKTIDAGEKITKNNLTVQVLPFLSQADYDQLLSACDLNFVRGEDSWVRAIWAAKPFIWQPYFQEENTHLKKLEAFLASYYANLDAKDTVCQMHAAWAGQHPLAPVWRDYLDQLCLIADYTLQQSQLLAMQEDLAGKLVRFCHQIE